MSLTQFVADSVSMLQSYNSFVGDYDHNKSVYWSTAPEFANNQISDPPLDSTLASIFTTSLEITNGSAATALSTILTVLSSMAYYDQFQNYGETTEATTRYFQPFLFPQSFRGLSAVLAVAAIHILLVLLITATFVASTRLTALGDHWQSISQVISPATQSFLADSSYATDKEVRAFLKAERREGETVCVQPLDEDVVRVGLVTQRGRRRIRTAL